MIIVMAKQEIAVNRVMKEVMGVVASQSPGITVANDHHDAIRKAVESAIAVAGKMPSSVDKHNHVIQNVMGSLQKVMGGVYAAHHHEAIKRALSNGCGSIICEISKIKKKLTKGKSP